MFRLARIFQNGMTLQRGKPVVLWGETDRPQVITVKLNGERWAENIKISGKFRFSLPPHEARENAILRIEGDTDRLTFSDVDIGEVWIAGGQSNMEFPLKYAENAAQEIAEANDEHLRFYDVGEYSYPGEETESPKDNRFWDRWLSLNPETAGAYSAVGLYFAQELRKKLAVPVAIVGCNWGGTSAMTWTDEETLQSTPELKPYLDVYKEKVEKLDMEDYVRKYKAAQKELQDPLFLRFYDRLMKGTLRWIDYVSLAPIGPRLMKYAVSEGPYSENRPAGLYNMMVSQIAGYTARGVIWYQGESDEVRAEIYHIQFQKLIESWRRAWRDAFPFLFVQLAPYEQWLGGKQKAFPEVREKQEWVSKHVPDAYMVSIMDVGAQKDIHPKRKKPVGQRLALMAMGKVYGEEIECEAPELTNVHCRQGKIILSFSHAGKGLTLRGEHLSAMKLILSGSEKKYWTASVKGNFVEISAFGIREHTHIRLEYAHEAFCEVNLYNSVGLPAKPFVWDSESKKGISHDGTERTL